MKELSCANKIVLSDVPRIHKIFQLPDKYFIVQWGHDLVPSAMWLYQLNVLNWFYDEMHTQDFDYDIGAWKIP